MSREKAKENLTHKVMTVIGTVFCIILIPILIINVSLIVRSFTHPDEVPSVGGIFPMIVLTDSMYTQIHSGDLIICHTEDPENIKVGDVISFFDPAGNGTSVVTHKVVQITEKNGEIAWVTRGIANNADDAMPVPADKLVGVYQSRIPGLGNVVMFMQTTGVNAITSEPMTFNTTGIRGFDASVNKTALNYGDSFTYAYTVTGASNDSKYTGRKLALVISGENLPSDAYLLVNDVVKSQNAYKQFIIPLGDATTKGTFTREIAFKCDSLENNLSDCTLKASLMVSATANADKPLRGVEADSETIDYSAMKRPSLKITSMSDRALAIDELANTVTLSYDTQAIPEGAVVTLEIQKEIGAGYTTDSTYLESLSPNGGSDAGVFTVNTSGGTLTMKFSPTALTTGNYQVMMCVKKDGAKLLEVPYRFVVTD